MDKLIVPGVVEDRRQGWPDTKCGNASWFTFFSSETTPTAGMIAGLMELPPHNGRLELHCHAQADIYFVAAGEGTLTLGDSETAIRAGAAVFIPSNTMHALRNEAETVLKIFYVFPADSFKDIEYHFSNLSA